MLSNEKLKNFKCVTRTLEIKMAIFSLKILSSLTDGMIVLAILSGVKVLVSTG